MKDKKIFTGNRGEGCLFFLLGLALLIYSLANHDHGQVEWILSPYLFPLLISVLMMVFSAILFFEKGFAPLKVVNKNESLRKVVIFTLLSLAYYAALPFAGFIITTAVFLFASLFFLGERRPAALVSVSVLTPLVIYILFGRLLHVMLP